MMSLFSDGHWFPVWLHPESMFVGALLGILATLYLQLFQKSFSANVDDNGLKQIQTSSSANVDDNSIEKWQKNSWQFQDAQWHPDNMNCTWKQWQHQCGENGDEDDFVPYDATLTPFPPSR